MKGFESMYAQSILFEEDVEFARFPPTPVKIYESEKDKVSPTILCGPSKMILNGEAEICTARTLRGRCLWSFVLGSHSNAMQDGFLTNASHFFVGCTHFISDETEYQNFLDWMKDKSPINDIPDLISGKAPNP